ncbi:molybdate ABC transporter substrate-binding protein [Ilyomonas limi]|uniref:Molybdate ABC transporter substrate-binding protein n=1 Tax=Ilyomonas limi TaxID=2575867 RepID=A0A4U3L650_9BACT|nr:molybdate ABC transporter substrate-binding protein [Ilyomonas limi]TKK69844.1 molybdate ABC transporter substrate-binding protein [Ilyomonas limi]
MKYLFCLGIFCLMVFASFAQPLHIAVAANAQFVAAKLKDAFTKETGITAKLIISSSGKLTAQIKQGAPFNVFLSADMKYPQELYSKGLTTARPQVYAYGALVLWTLKNIDLNKGLSILLDNNVQKIAVANPKLAPYGEAAIQALTKQHLLPSLQQKIVYGENIAQVNQYVLSGAADVAFTAKSVVLDSAVSGKGKWIEVNQNWHSSIAQGAVVIKQSNAAQMRAANQFYQFLFSKKAKDILEKYGYR